MILSGEPVPDLKLTKLRSLSPGVTLQPTNGLQVKYVGPPSEDLQIELWASVATIFLFSTA